MFHRILVALDQSEHRQQVFESAATLAQAMNAKLKLLQVLTSTEADFPIYPLTQMDVGFMLDDAMYKELLQQYARERQEFEVRHRDRLQRLADAAIAQGIPTEYLLGVGSPGQQICQIARDWGADAIVLGRRGNSGIKELLMGSVSNYVVHHAPCSVLVMQGTAIAQENSERVADCAQV